MALTFFWRCEGEALDATHDFSAGATTMTASGASIDAAAVKYGTNGILVNAVGDDYRCNVASIGNRLVGSMGCWIKQNTGQSAIEIIGLLGSVANNYIALKANGTSNEFELHIRDNTAGLVTLATSGLNYAVDTWYFILGRWDQANNARKIEAYDATGALITSNADLTTAYTSPADLTNASGFRIGDYGGGGSFAGGETWHMDNIFVSDVYAEPIENNLTITSYTAYSGSSQSNAPRSMFQLMMGRD